MRRINKSVWLPAALLMAGAAFYIYDGVEYNSWMHNLPMMVVDILIVLALLWALRKKEQMARRREESYQANEISESNKQ